MNFQEFTVRMENDLRVALEADHSDVFITKNEVNKMQGQSYTALTVKGEAGNVGINVNLDSLYHAMEHGVDYKSVLSEAVLQAEHFIENPVRFDVDRFTDYDISKSNLSVEVVGTDKNKEMLSSVPHTPIEDMSMVYRIIVDKLRDGISSILITNDLLERMGITKEQLHQDALEVSKANQPLTIRTMAEVMADMMGIPPQMAEDFAPPLFIVSNEDTIKGASAFFYPGAMETCSEAVGGDYFVLPSSVHEVLLLPDDGTARVADLEDMVSSINQGVVAEEDVLTDKVYHYDAKERIFELGEKFEARKAEKEMDKAECSSVLQQLKEKQKEVTDAPKANTSRDKAEMLL